MMDDKLKILFLCRANSAHSIMAEAMMRKMAGDRFKAFSAGLQPALRVHRLTLEQLKSTIVVRDRLRPKSWTEFSNENSPQMDFIIALTGEVSGKSVPVFPGKPLFCQWKSPDPLVNFMIEDAQKRAFEQVYRHIQRRISIFTGLPLRSMDTLELARALSAPLDSDEDISAD